MFVRVGVALFISVVTMHHAMGGEVARRPYLPLARVVIAAEGQSGDVMNSIVKFFEEKGLRVEHGEFPVSRRTAANLKVHVSTDSFFYADNFVSSDQIILNAYSHDQTSDWIDQWKGIVRFLTAHFGPARVKTIQEP